MIIGLDISVLNDQQRTGIASYTYQLIDALLKINHQHKFILFGIATFDTLNYLKNLDFKKYPNVERKIYRLPARLSRTTFLLWQKIGWPPIETFTGSVDIFHSFNWYLPPQKKGKIVGSIFDLTSLMKPTWHDQRTTQLDKVRIERIARMADLVVTISENSKRDFLKFYPNTEVIVLYPGVSAIYTQKQDKLKVGLVLRKYHLIPGYFLSAGTIEPRKNLSRLIKAYLSLNTQRPLVLVGGLGWKYDGVLKEIRQTQKIQMLGFVPDEDLKVLYQQALCLVYPSLYEGFGMPVLEAMACGTPVICSDTSSFPEVGGNATVYVDPQKIDNIAKAMDLLQKNPTLRQKLKKLGLKQAKKFSWEKSAKKLMWLYQKLYLG